MSSKVEKPTLQGQRIKTRKRDEKEKYDPNTFRDLILQGVQEILQQSNPQETGTADQLVSAVAAVQITDAPNSDSLPADADSSNLTQFDQSKTASSSETSDDESNSESAAVSTHTCEVGASRNIHFERNQFDALSKFLDVSGSKLNYRRYGDVLLDIIIAGGILGTVILFSLSFSLILFFPLLIFVLFVLQSNSSGRFYCGTFRSKQTI